MLSGREDIEWLDTCKMGSIVWWVRTSNRDGWRRDIILGKDREEGLRQQDCCREGEIDGKEEGMNVRVETRRGDKQAARK